MALAIRFEKLVQADGVQNYAALARLGYVTRARQELIAAQLIAYQKPLYQVLALGECPGARPRQTVAEQRQRRLPEPAALHLTRREDLPDLELPEPDLGLYDPGEPPIPDLNSGGNHEPEQELPENP